MRDSIVFVGGEQQFKSFVSEVGYDVDFIEAEDMLEAAKLVRGAKGVIGDGVVYALAEMMKLPRVKVGGDSTMPIGGAWCDTVYSDIVYEAKIEQFMKRG